MIVIGVAGGIASGKSLVSALLRELGAETLDADRAGHAVLREPDVVQALHRRWGDAVLHADGSVNRQAVAEIVFAPTPTAPAELFFLETITHPRIGEHLQQRLTELAANPEVKAATLDAAVMFKAGWDRFCDKLLFVDAPLETRLARGLQRGWTPQQFHSREAAQTPLELKRQRADIIIDNSGSLAHTRHQVQDFWYKYVSG